ncbi:BZ3500_MvSof-1268-A1-R1_Chr1-1g01042 [Microbotryum saponariae]|uniref:BZ3500_MvSof-1268-A1-R1_Chr1-1g01042 protein n=1 Tax=Microbotryum saponariae TaxID=289078 RepID=A0A2X0L3G5_9BASI|nr:BZ3500_MvSof-1268-A1-R1_Chr1-1g01042 [Microbotryum saponariae]SCZ93271.1 BZ3501_MvSof-1269-A2-R1_Chr1-1g00639 [Microbotryum saponariae]
MDDTKVADHPSLQSVDYAVSGLASQRQRGYDDEAIQVLQFEWDSQPPITDEEERELIKMIDWRILPLICFGTAMQYADKAALSVGALFGLIRDLKLFVAQTGGTFDTHKYTLVSIIYYVGYVVGTPILSTVAQRFPTGKICSLYVLLWGIVTLLTPTCTGFEGIMGQRFVLGILEGGVSPAFLTILGMWYRKREQALRAPILYSANGFFVLPLLAVVYGIVHIGSRAHAWKSIYYFLGVLTIIFACFLYVFLPDSPVSAKWLTSRQRYVAVERLRDNQAGLNSKRLKGSHLLEAVCDIKVVVLVLATFCTCASAGVIGAFSPLVISKGYGADALRTLLLLMPTGVVAGFSNIIGGYIALKYKNTRIAVIISLSILSATGTALQWRLTLAKKEGLLAGVYLIVASSGALGGLTGLACTLSNTAGATKKIAVSGLVFISIAGANIATPFLFKKSEQPRYPFAFKVTMILQCAGIGLCVVYGALCIRENRRRDRSVEKQAQDLAFSDSTDKQNAAFRYVW